MIRLSLLAAALLVACGDADLSRDPLSLRAVQFNVGTTPGLSHDADPDDGYSSAQAAVSDEWYGNGLAWRPVVEDARRFFEDLEADVIAFQEIFDPAQCADIPAAFHAGFVCEGWAAGDPTVAQSVLGSEYQVACQQGRPDKCAAVARRFGTFRGCASSVCLDGLDGARVPECGGGSRVGRGVIELAGGGTLTVVTVHGTSGFSADDVACRVAQFEQVFVDLGTGDGEPAANGERNLILGDFNTDPGRAAPADPSAVALLRFAGPGEPFAFVSEIGADAVPTYLGSFNIDHVLSDELVGQCFSPGVTGGAPVSPVVYFDHAPIVCDLSSNRSR